MGNVTLFAAFGDHAIQGMGSDRVALSMGEGIRLEAGKLGEIIRPPPIRPVNAEPTQTLFDEAAGLYRMAETPSGPAETEEAIVLEAPTAGELAVGQLDELVAVAKNRKSDLFVLLKRNDG